MGKTNQRSLGDFILDRTESLDEALIKEYFIDRNDDKISRLLDSEQYILEGSRGIGKTMLMQSAKLKAKKDFGKTSILSVWVSFEESIRIERIKVIDSSIDPFFQWTMGKILNEILSEVTSLKPLCIDQLNTRLSKIFGKKPNLKYDQYNKVLNEYLQILEKGDIKDSKVLNKKVPSTELANILDNPTSFKQFLLELISDFELKRIVLLFDEAAHVFSSSQQEKFFTFFKTLRHPKIACKAAVYPGITNYGKYFERGQDAKELRINWSPTNAEDIKYIKEILKKRIQKFDNKYWERLTDSHSIIDTICICSNGNPRFTFHILDALENNGVFKKKITSQNVINNLRIVFNNKWREFDTLKQRLVKYKNYIEEAEFFIKNFIIPNLREWNVKQRSSGRKLSIGFYISTKAYDQISHIFEILAYSNILIIDYSKKSVGKSQYGYFVSLNPSLLFTDLIIRDITEFKQVSTAIEYNQAYYDSTLEIKRLIEKLKTENEVFCSNSKCTFKTSETSYSFCPNCGSKINIADSESLYKILRSHSLDYLKLSSKITSRLKSKYSNIGELYDADPSEIKMKYIKNVRISLIKSAVIEYMAG